MNHPIQKLLEQKQLHSIQSWYEPALFLLGQLMQSAKANLQKRKYPESNAAVNRHHFREHMQRRFRLPMQLVIDIESSMAKAKKIEVIGASYIRPVMQEEVNK